MARKLVSVYRVTSLVPDEKDYSLIVCGQGASNDDSATISFNTDRVLEIITKLDLNKDFCLEDDSNELGKTPISISSFLLKTIDEDTKELVLEFKKL